MHVVLLLGLIAALCCSAKAGGEPSPPQQLGPFALREHVELPSVGEKFAVVRSPEETRGHRFVGVLVGNEVGIVHWRKDDSVKLPDYTADILVNLPFTPIVALDERGKLPWDPSVTRDELVLHFRTYYLPEKHLDIPILDREMEEFRYENHETGAITVMTVVFENGALVQVSICASDLMRRNVKQYWRNYWEKKAQSKENVR